MRRPFALPAFTARPMSWLVMTGARLLRPMTLGVRAVLLDQEGRVFLVRHSYVPGWHLPGGGVEPGETIRAAIIREVREEAGLAVTGTPHLLGVYFNNAVTNRDHVAVFVIRDVAPLAEARPDWEIAERGFFAPDRLPAATTAPTRARLAEALDGVATVETW